MEDDLAAGVGERAAAGRRPQRVLKDVLTTGVVLEIVAAPVGPVGGVVPFENAVVARHAGSVEAGADGVVVLQIRGHVHLQVAFEGAGRGRELQEIVVERRP